MTALSLQMINDHRANRYTNDKLTKENRFASVQIYQLRQPSLTVSFRVRKEMKINRARELQSARAILLATFSSSSFLNAKYRAASARKKRRRKKKRRLYNNIRVMANEMTGKNLPGKAENA